MAQVTATAPQEKAHSSANKGNKLCLCSLDGGGVRGLSSLQILKQLMELIDPKNPPKPCDYFDMIGGTSTGGLIAIMLGRLRLSVDECIEEYKKLSDRVFTKLHHRVTVKGKVQGRFDHEALVAGVQELLERKGLPKDELLRDDIEEGCKT
jgi:patatin-like phospholipase/acyl hydrolase